MKQDIYLNRQYSPLFLESKGKWSLVMVNNDVKIQALRNRVRERINLFFLDSIAMNRKITDRDKWLMLNFIATEAQFLGISLTGENLNQIKFSVTEDKKIQILLNL